jgi:hypothetical protein
MFVMWSIAVSSCKRHRLTHNRPDVQNMVLHCALHIGVNLSKNNGCSNSSCTCRTPLSNLNILYGTSWMGMDFFFNFILRVHVSTELKPSYTINRMSGGGVCPSCILLYDMYCTVCARQLSNMVANAVFLLHFVPVTHTSLHALHVKPVLFLEVCLHRFHAVFLSMNLLHILLTV